ncbi:hypothetical protein [Enterococcus casseliflavus]|uniref:hypothetical protein n=1 Tax=Enterococcus casseliflavus TaxID=37734 RepID=UPI001BCCCE04|nr:hypothetical protein [Enterococcus casseliflavus]
MKKALRNISFGLSGVVIGVVVVLIIFYVNNLFNGQILEWITALSTLGAVIASLWLARDKKSDSEVSGGFFNTEAVVTSTTEYSPETGTNVYTDHKYILFRTKLRIHNSSDFPKSLYDLHINFLTRDGNIRSTRQIKYKDIYCDYISLSPGDTKVLTIETDTDFSMEERDVFIPKEIYFSGLNEKSEEVRFYYDEYSEKLKQVNGIRGYDIEMTKIDVYKKLKSEKELLYNGENILEIYIGLGVATLLGLSISAVEISEILSFGIILVAVLFFVLGFMQFKKNRKLNKSVILHEFLLNEKNDEVSDEKINELFNNVANSENIGGDENEIV